MWDDLWTDARLLTMDPSAGRGGLGTIERGAIAAEAGRIAWVGPQAALPGGGPGGGPPESLARRVHRAAGRLLTPGLIDCHTHLVFAGDERIGEFERQLEGATRRELAAAGGGILATMRATRAAGEEALLAGAARRLAALMEEGVTTVEIKSGYGLDRETELRMLRVARRLGREQPVTVVTSFLGAHVLAPEFAGPGGADAFIDVLAREVLPAAVAEGLVDLCDGGVEELSIPTPAMLRLYRAAQALGLGVRGHTDQYRDVGGAGILAGIGAVSADHLEYSSEASIAAMARAGTVAVLLPGANLFLGETRRPPVALFREHGVPMALATNCNPGSSPTLSPRLVLALGCMLFRLTPEEALRGMTVEAARALGLAGRTGKLRVGLPADFALWETGGPAELCYWLGGPNPCVQVVKAGRIVRGGAALDQDGASPVP